MNTSKNLSGNNATGKRKASDFYKTPYSLTEQLLQTGIVARDAQILEPASRYSNGSVHFSSKTDLWSTPQDLFDALDAEFGFTLDVCALPENAKCAQYFTPSDDGLAQPWEDNVCWMNPPYGRTIGKWVKKAYESSLEGETVVCLLPSRTDTQWWHEYITKAAEIRFFKGRLKFGEAKNSAPFPSVVVIFRPGLSRLIGRDGTSVNANTTDSYCSIRNNSN